MNCIRRSFGRNHSSLSDKLKGALLNVGRGDIDGQGHAQDFLRRFEDRFTIFRELKVIFIPAERLFHILGSEFGAQKEIGQQCDHGNRPIPVIGRQEPWSGQQSPALGCWVVTQKDKLQ